MKVFIGKYPKTHITCQIHTRYMNWKYGIVNWPVTQTKFEDFLEKTEDRIQDIYHATINKLLDKRQRKIKVKLHPYDTWNADQTLAYIIHPMLIQLRNTQHGSAHVDDEDVPEELKSTSAPPKENDWDSDENFHKRWEYVLDEMIFAFGVIADDATDIEGKFNDRITNGLRLFGKYYRGLWD